jgi:predicted dehydrogenase
LGLKISNGLVATQDRPEEVCDGGVFYDLEEALATRPELVVIATPTSLHLDAAMAALRSGAAVFIEKPIAHSLEGVDELNRLASEYGATVTIGCQLRFHPALRALKRLIDDGKLGRLVAVHAEQGEYLPSYHPYEDYRESYAARRDLGGGVVLTQIHELDYLQWIFGVPRSVYAVGGTVGALGIDVEDTVDALLANQIDGKPLAIHVHLDFLQRPSRRRCRVVGDMGCIEVDLLEPSLVWTGSDGEIRLEERYPGFDRSELFVEEMRSFVEAVDGSHDVEVGLAHATDTLRIAVAVRESMKTGEAQTL